MKSTNIDDWLCLCTPLSCFQRKQTNEDLKCCYDELNSEKVDVIETQIKFIKRCISQDNKIIQIIADGISRGMDYKALIRSIDPLITMKTAGSINLLDDNFNDLYLPESKGLNTPELVESVKGKLQDKLRIMEKEHKVMVDRNQHLNQIMFDIIENWRNEYFDVITRKVDEKISVNNKLSKKEFKQIINTNNTAWFNLMFNYIDDDGDGLIEWNQFEIQLEEILQML
ncbi:hypothetical protein MACJ_001687 [Theileria orientalis]|uniref:EF-hand domain-containing protein n=1 Tax=Theileria orientalis TaxID=68886 RepID=A0A976M915_THEOR|nr:hypothetical protein MACJ_001687 [Theileria orientalis]